MTALLRNIPALEKCLLTHPTRMIGGVEVAGVERHLDFYERPAGRPSRQISGNRET